VQLTLTFTSYTVGTLRDGGFCLHSTANGDSAVSSLADMYKLPAFSSAAVVSGQTSAAFTIAKTLDGAGTVYAVACKGGSTAPSVTDVEASHCASASTPEASTSGNATADLTLGGSLAFPYYDLYVVGTYGSQHEAAVHSLTTQFLNAPTGFQYVTLASVTDSGSVPKRFNDYPFITLSYDTQSGNFHVGDVLVDNTSGAWGIILVDGDAGSTGILTIDKRSGTFADNDAIVDQSTGAALVNGSESAYVKIAIGDVLSIATSVSPAGIGKSCPSDPACITIDTSGQVSYTANGVQSALNGLIYDASAQGYMSLDSDLWFNNQAPVGQPFLTPFVFKTGVAITPIDLNAYCTDPETGALTFGRTGGTAPTGLAFNASTGIFSGTPTVQNYSGVVLSFACLDVPGAYVALQFTAYPITNWPAPDCTTTPTQEDECRSDVTTLTFASVTVDSTSVCNGAVAAGTVLSQNPAAGAAVAPGDTLELMVAGACGGHGGRHLALRDKLRLRK
jgi:hypothetical protein